MSTKIIDKSQYNIIVNALHNGEVVAFPTETVMGLAVDAFNEDAYKSLIEVKNRPANKAFPFIVKNKEEIEKYAYVDEKTRKIIDKFMPGPITLILNKKELLPAYITNNKSSIAIRIPNDEVVLEILKEFNKPILLTSANKSGEDPALNSNQCYKIFKNDIRYFIFKYFITLVTI